MTNILIDNLPFSVWIGDQEVPINTDYRTGILFEQLISNAGLSDEEKISEAVELYYGDGIVPFLQSAADAMEAVNRLIWFYRCGREMSEGEAESGGSGTKDPPFSYEYDAEYIYAAFMEAYRIDLTKDRLHWWKFRALFLSLPETTQFQKIVGYRVMDIPSKMPKEQKRFYQQMKKRYALPKSEDQKELEKNINEILEKGGDISALL